MSQIRANKLEVNNVYLMRTFRRRHGFNYEYQLIRFVSRTSEKKLNELGDDDEYHVILGDQDIILRPRKGVLMWNCDGRDFRVTFETKTEESLEKVNPNTVLVEPREPLEPRVPREPREPLEPREEPEPRIAV